MTRESRIPKGRRRVRAKGPLGHQGMARGVSINPSEDTHAYEEKRGSRGHASIRTMRNCGKRKRKTSEVSQVEFRLCGEPASD